MRKDRRTLRTILLHCLIEKKSRTRQLFHYFLLPAIVATLCCGCFRNTLPADPFPPHLPRLIKLAEQQIPLVVRNEHDMHALGHQYLLFLPISRIYAPHLADLLVQRLSLEAGLRKYGLIYQSNSTLSIPRLEITIQKAHINGFDLLAIRRPSAGLMVKATYFKPDNAVRECTSIQNHSEFRAFAFNKELQETLETAIDTAAEDLVECLGFSNPALPYSDSLPNEMH